MTKKTYKNQITHARLLQLITFDRDSGDMLPMNEKASDVYMDRGYPFIRLDGQRYNAASIAWFYHRGEWPKGKVTFIDEDRTFLSIYNLSDDTGPLKTHKGTVSRYLMSQEALDQLEKEKAEARFLADMAEMD